MKKMNKNAVIGIFIFIFIVCFSGSLGTGDLLNVKTAFGYGGITYSGPRPAPVYQTYDPNTGELTTEEETTEEETTAGTPEESTEAETETSLDQMATDAETVSSGSAGEVAAEAGVARDTAKEAEYGTSIVDKIVGADASTAVRDAVVNFVTYGTVSTKTLGAGERGGVVDSFQAAFGKLPSTSADWNDVMKIGNGRWPSQTNQSAEDTATASFKKIYLRDPNRANAHDDAAVTVMAYGLRPADRNLDSEKAAIKIFKNIYGSDPSSATDWDAVRAIAYSGAVR